MKIREKGSNIIFSIILSLLGRKLSGEEGKGTKTFCEEKQKMGVGMNIKL